MTRCRLPSESVAILSLTQNYYMRAYQHWGPLMYDEAKSDRPLHSNEPANLRAERFVNIAATPPDIKTAET